MGEAKHSPGPWSLPHFAEPEVNCSCGYVLTDHMMGAVATVHCTGEGDDWQKGGDNPKFAEAVANAHLIAAAPELLSELGVRVGDLVMLKRAIEEGDPKPELLFRIEGMLRETRAAIAKASPTP